MSFFISSDLKSFKENITKGVLNITFQKYFSLCIHLISGEYIVKEETDRRDDLSEDEPPSSLLPEPEFSLEEALQLVGLNDDLQVKYILSLYLNIIKN